MNRPIVGPLNNTGIDESTDAYDTIDWLVKNVPESNGKVGIDRLVLPRLHDAGVRDQSAPGAEGRGAAKPDGRRLDGRRLVPQRRVPHRQPRFRGVAEHRQGRGRRHSPTAPATITRAISRPGRWPTTPAGSSIEHYPFVQKLFQNPAYTEFWSLQAVDKWLAARPLTVPTMLEVGQWDQEDSYGAPAVYKALKDKYEGSGLLHLVIGPWRHSGANHYGYDLGALTFTGDTAREWRVKYVKPFFDHYLKGAPDPQTPPVLTYATGINQWQASPRWPMGTPTPLYLARGNGAELRPARRRRATTITSPTRPSRCPSFRARSTWTTPTSGSRWLVHDQRFVTDRPDVAQLHDRAADQGGAHHGRAAGRPVRRDQRHRQRLGGEADRRLSQRNARRRRAGLEAGHGRLSSCRSASRSSAAATSTASPSRAPLRAGKVEHYAGACPTSNHVFLPGHRIMVQVQSSLFPLYDRNPQTFVPNIFYAKAGRLSEGDAERLPRRGERRARSICRSFPRPRHVSSTLRLICSVGGLWIERKRASTSE